MIGLGLGRRVDAWLFADGSPHRLAALRIGLALVLGLRAATWPFTQLAGTPSSLFRPPLLLSWAGGFPSAAALGGLQVLGVAGAIAAVAGSVRGTRAAAVWGLRAAWLALLVLGGFKTSTGKLLHNDVLVLLATVPVVLCAAPARLGDGRRTDAATGWPLRAALVVVAVVYACCGLAKLRHSGVAWVASDNMQWILDGGARSGRAPTTFLASALAGSAVASMAAAAGLLGLELSFPLVLFERRARIPMAIGAAMLHTMTWLMLGLDYWAWSAVAVLVLGLSARPLRSAPTTVPTG